MAVIGESFNQADEEPPAEVRDNLVRVSGRAATALSAAGCLLVGRGQGDRTWQDVLCCGRKGRCKVEADESEEKEETKIKGRDIGNE